LSGANAKAYEMALDHETVHGGKSSATIRCRNKHCGEFGNIVQTVKSDEYQGRRIRLSAWVKGNKAGHAGLWMRVDGPHSEILAFDNMQTREKAVRSIGACRKSCWTSSPLAW